MTLFHFFIAFILLLVISSVIICGWYSITRGEVDFKSDGTSYRKGKIFKAWHFFWTQGLEIRIRVQGMMLAEAVVKINDRYNLKLIPNLQLDAANIEQDDEAIKNVIDKTWEIYKITGLYMHDKAIGDTVYFEFFKDECNYIFPEWMRSPMSECVNCMASVYGTIIWAAVQILSNAEMFSWCQWPVFAALFFWVLFCMALSALNGIIIKLVL